MFGWNSASLFQWLFINLSDRISCLIQTSIVPLSGLIIWIFNADVVNKGCNFLALELEKMDLWKFRIHLEWNKTINQQSRMSRFIKHTRSSDQFIRNIYDAAAFWRFRVSTPHLLLHNLSPPPHSPSCPWMERDDHWSTSQWK